VGLFLLQLLIQAVQLRLPGREFGEPLLELALQQLALFGFGPAFLRCGLLQGLDPLAGLFDLLGVVSPGRREIPDLVGPQVRLRDAGVAGVALVQFL
jgi:hypothetical protein